MSCQAVLVLRDRREQRLVELPGALAGGGVVEVEARAAGPARRRSGRRSAGRRCRPGRSPIESASMMCEAAAIGASRSRPARSVRRSVSTIGASAREYRKSRPTLEMSETSRSTRGNRARMSPSARYSWPASGSAAAAAAMPGHDPGVGRGDRRHEAEDHARVRLVDHSDVRDGQQRLDEGHAVAVQGREVVHLVLALPRGGVEDGAPGARRQRGRRVEVQLRAADLHQASNSSKSTSAARCRRTAASPATNTLS